MGIKRFFGVFLTAALASGVGGCAAMEDMFGMNFNYTPKYVLSLHSVVQYPRGNSIEQELYTFSGEKIIINRNQFFGSAQIMEAKVLPRQDDPSFSDLSIKINPVGQQLWLQLSVDFREEPLAVLLDGVYVGMFRPGEIPDPDDKWVTLRCRFNNVQARGIAKYAKRNFREFSPAATSLR